MEIGPSNTQHNITSFNVTKQIKRRKYHAEKLLITNQTNKISKTCNKSSKQQNKKSMQLLTKQYCIDGLNINNKDLFDDIIERKHECLICNEQYPLYQLQRFKEIKCHSCRIYLNDHFIDYLYTDEDKYNLIFKQICSHCSIYHDICYKNYKSPFCKCTSCNKYGNPTIQCVRCQFFYCTKTCSVKYSNKCNNCHKCDRQKEKRQQHTNVGMRLLNAIKNKICINNDTQRYTNMMKKQRKFVFRNVFNELSVIFGGYDDLVNLILDYMCKYEDFVRDITYIVSCCNYRCGDKFIEHDDSNIVYKCYCGSRKCPNTRIIMGNHKGYVLKNGKATRMFVIKDDKEELYCMENGIYKKANYFKLNDKYVRDILLNISKNNINAIGVCKIGNEYFRIFCEECKDKYMYKFATKCAKYECKNKDITKYCRIHYKLEQMRINIEWDERYMILENYNANNENVCDWKKGFYWDNKSIDYNKHLIINIKRTNSEYNKQIIKKANVRIRRNNNMNRKSYSKRRWDKKMNIKSRKRANKMYLHSLEQF